MGCFQRAGSALQARLVEMASEPTRFFDYSCD